MRFPQPDGKPELMIVTKDNQKSRVHRPAYLDYIAFRIFDADDRVIGERRFLGLFSSSAYSESVARIPVLRQKAAAVIQLSGYSEHSHGGKAIMDVLETYPRDELFQTPLPELAAIVEKVAHLKERRQVRMFVRRDPYGRYLSCLIYLPRDRYTTVGTQSDGETPDECPRRSLDRLHGPRHRVRAREAALRRPDARRQGHGRGGRAIPGAGADAGHPLLGRRIRRPDGWRGSMPSIWRRWWQPCPRAIRRTTPLGRPRRTLLRILSLDDVHDMSMAMYMPDRPDDEAQLRLKIFRSEASLSLSRHLAAPLTARCRRD